MSKGAWSQGTLVRNWILAAMCWSVVGAYGPAEWTRAEEKLPPKAWIQRYLGVEFPDSAKHFELHYRSSNEDVVLFSFDLDKADLEHLLDGKSIFPSRGDLVPGASAVPEWIVRDPGSQYFAQEVGALQYALSAIKTGAGPAHPRELRWWTSELPSGAWQMCVSIMADKQIDKANVSDGFAAAATPQEIHSCIIIDSRPGRPYDTCTWQRWSLDEAGYREFLQMVETHSDVERYSGVAAERLAGRLDAQGPGLDAPWWKPVRRGMGFQPMQHRQDADATKSHGQDGTKRDSSRLGTHARATSPDLLEGFRYRGSDLTSALVMGRVEGLFCCYAYTQRNVLVPDPLDAIRSLLGLPLPASTRAAHYESGSSMAGVVYWMRFDLPRCDFATCLARTPSLPTYAEFGADVALKEYLQTAYQTGAPEWWQPQELNEGIYALRRSNMKNLTDVSVGLSPLPEEKVRVYIGAFSAW